MITPESVVTEPGRTPGFPARVPWRAVAVFTVVAFGLAWVIVLPLWLGDPAAPTTAELAGVLVPAMMFSPLIATVCAIGIARIPGRGQWLRGLGMWPLRPARRVVWGMVWAMLGTFAVIALSVAVAALCGWTRLDLVHFSGFAETLAASVPAGLGDMLPPAGTVVALQLLTLPIGVLINSFLAFGEEIGWRGWLLPALRPLGTWPALAISGAIWGLWHTPVILLGHNFGLLDWRGVALMTVSCVFWGVLIGWTRLRSGSVWPAVIAHASLNAGAAMILLFAAAGVEYRQALVLPLGVAGWIAAAIVIIVLVLTGQFREDRQHQLAPPAPVLLTTAPGVDGSVVTPQGSGSSASPQ